MKVQVANGGGAAAYVCPMHPEVTSSAPGLCPKCNMKLVPHTTVRRPPRTRVMAGG
jgi:hypothetical protein